MVAATNSRQQKAHHGRELRWNSTHHSAGHEDVLRLVGNRVGESTLSHNGRSINLPIGRSVKIVRGRPPRGEGGWLGGFVLVRGHAEIGLTATLALRIFEADEALGTAPAAGLTWPGRIALGPL